MRRLLNTLFVGLLLAAGMSAAALELPRIFSDAMIVQRERPVRVWGTARLGSEITVAFDGGRYSGNAGGDGYFCVELPPQKASAAGRELTVTGDGTTLRFRDVVVGDVWLCAGQSNMQFELKKATGGAEILANAANPSLRLFQVKRRWSRSPERQLEGGWQISSPASAMRFSAVGWLFGNRLRKTLDVPVGLIDLSWGGCRIEAMLAPDAMRSAGVSQPVRQRFEQELQSMAGMEDQALRKDKQRLPSVLFNGMLHPLTPFGIRGVLWYQGEDNHSEGMVYAEKLRALADTLRRYFRDGRLGIYLVQLPPWQYGQESPLRIPRFRQAQQFFAEHDRCSGFIVTTDCGDPADIHPREKRVLAERLAALVLYRAYGVGDSTALAPVLDRAVREGGAVRVRFRNANGLRSRDGKPLTYWELGDDKGKFFEASATPDGDDVLVSCQHSIFRKTETLAQSCRATAAPSDAGIVPRRCHAAECASVRPPCGCVPAAPHPVKVRFGFHKLANPNLVNRAGVPAAPFEADVQP